MRIALALGLFGLIIFAQAPMADWPFLLLAMILAWRAQARRQAFFTEGNSPAPQSPPITVYSSLRLVLLLAAGGAALLGMMTMTEVISALARSGAFNWQFSGVGLLIAGACAWAAFAIWRFRAKLVAPNLAWQVTDGAMRLAASVFAILVVLFVASVLPGSLAESTRNGSRAGLCLVLPVLAFGVALALGFAHRDRLAQLLPSRPVLRGALWAATAGGAFGAATIVVCVALSVASFEELSWAAACALIAAAAAADARSADPKVRHFGVAAGGAFMIAIGALITVMWIGQFRMGERMIEGWNVLILLMPFIFLATMAIAVALVLLGWRLYRRAYAGV